MILPTHLPIRYSPAARAEPTMMGGAASRLRSAASHVQNHFRSEEAVEELAGLTGLAAPELENFTGLGVLVPALPFMIAGTKGAIKEALKNVLEEYPAALEKLLSDETGILALLVKQGVPPGELDALKDRFADARGFLAAFRSGSLKPDAITKDIAALAQRLHDGAGHASDDLVLRAVQYQRDRQLLSKERVGAVGAGLEAVAMSLTTAGMSLPLAERIAGIVQERMGDVAEAAGEAAGTAKEAAEGAVHSLLGEVAGLVSLPMKTLSGVAAGVQVVKHVKIDKTHKEDLQAVHALRHDLPMDVKASLDQGLGRQRYYNGHQISANALTAVGQGALVTGAVLRAVDLSQILASSLGAAGVVLTVAGNVEKSIYQGKEKRFSGQGASGVVKSYADEHPVEELVRRSGLERAIEMTSARYRDAQSMLAEAKLLSVINDQLNAEKQDRIGRSVNSWRRYARIEGKLDGLHGSSRTTLLPADIEAARNTLRTVYPPEFLAGPASEVRARLFTRLTEFPLAEQVAGSEPFQQKVLTVLVAAAKKNSIDIEPFINRTLPGEVTARNIDLLRSDNRQVSDLYEKVRLELLIDQVKNDGKFLRQSMANDITALARAHRLDMDIYAAYAQKGIDLTALARQGDD